MKTLRSFLAALAATATITGAVMVPGGAPAGAAATYSVDDTGLGDDTNPGDGVCATAASRCTLTAAVTEANAALGASVITLGSGTYRVAPGAEIAADMTITGAGRTTTTIDLASSRGFRVNRAKVTFVDLTISGGQADGDGAAIEAVSAVLQLNRVGGVDNTATGNGGFLRANAGSVTVIDSVFSTNQAYNGGALAITNSAVKITGSTFHANGAAGSGGAVWLDHAHGVDVSDTSFDANVAVDRGGALFLDGITGPSSPAKITGVGFYDNRAANEGGGLFIGSTGGDAGIRTLTITDATFDGNVGIVGGGIASDQGRLSVNGSTFNENQATNGAGGGIASGGAVSVAASTFTGNVASTYGGAIAANGPATVTGSTFTGNSAGTQGGALALVGAQTPTVTGSVFRDNDADVDAGAIWRLGAALTQSGLTLNGNAPNDVVVEQASVAADPSEPSVPPTSTPGSGTTVPRPGADGSVPPLASVSPAPGAPGDAHGTASGSKPGEGFLARTGVQVTGAVILAAILIAAGLLARRMAKQRTTT